MRRANSHYVCMHVCMSQAAERVCMYVCMSETSEHVCMFQAAQRVCMFQHHLLCRPFGD